MNGDRFDVEAVGGSESVIDSETEVITGYGRLMAAACEGRTGELPGRCARCGKTIVDRYYLVALGETWHVECLKCSTCHVTLDSTCFVRKDKVYCRKDYNR